MPPRIFNIQKFSIYDGPGIRTLVFFKGCPLNCLWCSNPEGKSHQANTLWNEALCSHCGLCADVCMASLHCLENGRHKMDRQKQCVACGKCVEACPQRALKLCGQEITTAEILRIILEDEAFYKTSGGGVTLGGGEPMAQPWAALELLAACKAAGLSTAMETCGQASGATVTSLAPYVDLFLYDIKHMDDKRHRELTGVGNQQILTNLAWLLDKGHAVKVRMPLIDGCNADLGEMRKRAVFLSRWKDSNNFKGVDLLPYHRLGKHKYGQLGEAYSLADQGDVDQEFLQATCDIFAAQGIKTSILRH